jgi:hypothetical protein
MTVPARVAPTPVSAPADPLETFKARCWAKAMLVREGHLDLIDAVDALQNAAVAYGLVPDDRSQDEIQRIMADAFSWRAE